MNYNALLENGTEPRVPTNMYQLSPNQYHGPGPYTDDPSVIAMGSESQGIFLPGPPPSATAPAVPAHDWNHHICLNAVQSLAFGISNVPVPSLAISLNELLSDPNRAPKRVLIRTTALILFTHKFLQLVTDLLDPSLLLSFSLSQLLYAALSMHSDPRSSIPDEMVVSLITIMRTLINNVFLPTFDLGISV